MSAAARQLRLRQPTISRRLAALEAELGYPLFRRASTGVQLTAAGERLLEPARKMAEWASEVQRAAGAEERGPLGVVRLAAPPGVASDFVAPFAAWLRREQPGIRLEVLSSVHYLDLARGEADLAIRARSSERRELTTLASRPFRVAAMASRSYAARLRKGYRAKDIDWICWAPPYDELAPNPQLEEAIAGFVPAFTSDNYIVQRRAAETGLGAMVTNVTRHRFTRSPSLVPLDVELGFLGIYELHLVAVRSALETPRVRIVADLLMRELDEMDSGV